VPPPALPSIVKLVALEPKLYPRTTVAPGAAVTVIALFVPAHSLVYVPDAKQTVWPEVAAETWDEKFDVVAFRSQPDPPPPPDAATGPTELDVAEALPWPFVAVTTTSTLSPTSEAPSV
jgi:hypothetical protein